MTALVSAAPQIFTSEKSDWETPGGIDRPGTFFYNLHQEFDFDLDAAAHEMNAKLPHFLTEDDDALKMAWPGTRSWCNCPYGLGNVVGKWMNKFAIEFARKPREHLVALVAARTDTLWFHDIVWPLADEVRLVRGRLTFEVGGKAVAKVDKKGNMRVQPATFPSAVIVFRRKPLMRAGERPLFRSISPKGILLDEEVPI
jgi:phage N-6-adenine-methyltransferase